MVTRIVYEGDEEAAHQLLPQAQNLMYKVREFTKLSGAHTYSQSLALNDSSYAYCLKAGDIEVIHIVSLPHTSSSTTYPNTPVVIPDFLSGLIKGGVIRTDYLPPLPGDTRERKVRSLESFKPSTATASRTKIEPVFADSKRLAVTPHPAYFPEFIATSGGENTDRTRRRELSQYIFFHPSNYTGKMQRLAQTIFGYGRIPEYCVIEKDPIKRADIIREGIQFTLDCRWHRSHGLVTAADGALWVVEVSLMNGIIAMPLPIYPGSETLTESKYIDIATAAKEFGGLPTGQGFPTGPALVAAIKAGNVLRLLPLKDMADFYSLSPSSSMCGWAFNSKGTEAHNTGGNFADNGMHRSYHYQLAINIGSVKKDRKLGDPLANGSASLHKVSEDLYYYRSRFFPPCFKFHEPLLPGLLSLEMLPAEPEGGPSNFGKIVIDATLHVYYDDSDQLKLVKFYYNTKREPNVYELENDFEDCMFAGSWTQTINKGSRSIPPLFYTTDVDDRAAPTDDHETSHITGTDLGYFGPFINDDLADIRYADYYRAKYFRMVTETTGATGQRISNGVIIPEGIRNGLVYGFNRSAASTYKSTSTSYKPLQDPNYYRTFRILYNRFP